MGPFKCPDCGVWWAGFEHRCAPTSVATSTAPAFVFSARGHCHACSTALCTANDHVPCMLHVGGWTVT